MDFNMPLVFFGIFISSVFLNGIEGRSIIATEKQLRNSTTMTAKTIYGDIYDCVDIEKQPSLQDPSLAHHQIEEILENVRTIKKFADASRDGSFKHDEHKVLDLENIWLGKGCPLGTVPIPRRNGKEIPQRSISTKSLNQSLDDYNGGVEFVGIIVEQSGLFGASAQISIHNPTPVDAGQFSLVMIIIQNWPDQIEAGWTVNPDLYHDGQTRLYTWWRSATNSAGCYNTNCPGFVIVNDEIPLDYVFPQVSNPHTGEQHEVEITIQRGDAAGNWYLEVNGNILGFWRGNLLPNLANSAIAIRFGGQVYSTPPTDISPPMGSGLFYGDNPYRTCYMQNVQVRLDTFVPVPSNYQKIERSRCYLAGWDGYSGDDDLNGFRFLLGGTGGKAGADCLD